MLQREKRNHCTADRKHTPAVETRDFPQQQARAKIKVEGIETYNKANVKSP
jgi:hypothetical protein